LKIAVISHSYPTTCDPGRASFIKNEAHLISLDHQVEIHLPSVFSLPFQKAYRRNRSPLDEKLTVHSTTYFSVPRRYLSSITQKSLSSALMKTVQKQDPDLVHMHGLYPTGLAAKSLREAGYPVILTIHGGDWYYNLSGKKLMARLIEALYHCNRIVCVGKSLLDDIEQYEPGLREKLIHLPHGVDTDLFFPKPEPGFKGEKLKWESDKTHILAVGNLFRVKGYDNLLEAFATLKQHEDCRLHIVAPRFDQDAKTVADRLMETLKLHETVIFYDQKSPQELAEFYRSADFLVSSSRKEGFGLVVAEAIACGTPVVATRSGGPEEIVNENNGILVAADDPSALRDTLQDMIATFQQYKPDDLHNYISEHFSIDAKKAKLNRMYREVC